MPWGLKRFQQEGHLHFVTFSCYRRRPYLAEPGAYATFEQTLEAVRIKHNFLINGYVLMPEHVHLLVSEPETTLLANTLKHLKQTTSRKLKGDRDHFWQPRYYDFNVITEAKRVEKHRYMHRNPVKRQLVDKPEDWPWSSYRFYSTDQQGTVHIDRP